MTRRQTIGFPAARLYPPPCAQAVPVPKSGNGREDYDVFIFTIITAIIRRRGQVSFSLTSMAFSHNLERYLRVLRRLR
jgi:hypothetical protein